MPQISYKFITPINIKIRRLNTCLLNQFNYLWKKYSNNLASIQQRNNKYYYIQWFDSSSFKSNSKHNIIQLNLVTQSHYYRALTPQSQSQLESRTHCTSKPTNEPVLPLPCYLIHPPPPIPRMDKETVHLTYLSQRTESVHLTLTSKFDEILWQEKEKVLDLDHKL